MQRNAAWLGGAYNWEVRGKPKHNRPSGPNHGPKAAEATNGRGMSSQDEVIALLSRPEAYGLSDTPVERIVTHSAVIFLAGDLAYKIKRAVTYPFLDFSTLEKRRQACLNEIRVNMRTAAELYEGIVPITRDAKGRLHIAGQGETVEWAVRMRRFRQDDLFVERARAGRLTLDDILDLADVVRRFHDSAERVVRPTISVDGQRILIAQNEAALQAHPEIFPPDEAAELIRRNRLALAMDRELLQERAMHGAVRHCHGDLHLANIVRFEGRLLLFDAIEFDDAIATVDVLDDLAFLLMDLWYRDLHLFANRLLNRYLLKTGEASELKGLQLLPLFLSTRATIRAKADAFRAEAAYTPATDRDRLVRRARKKFEAALAFSAPAAPRLLAIGGFSGTGKTTLARLLAPQMGPPPGAIILRSDVERKQMFGAARRDPLPPDAYQPSVTRMVYGNLRKKAETALRAGHGVIVDAVHAREEEREAIAAVAERLGVAFDALWLEAEQDILETRVTRRENDASDATAEVVRTQLRRGAGTVSWPRLSATGTPEEVAAAARNLLVQMVPEN